MTMIHDFNSYNMAPGVHTHLDSNAADTLFVMILPTRRPSLKFPRFHALSRDCIQGQIVLF